MYQIFPCNGVYWSIKLFSLIQIQMMKEIENIFFKWFSDLEQLIKENDTKDLQIKYWWGCIQSWYQLQSESDYFDVTLILRARQKLMRRIEQQRVLLQWPQYTWCMSSTTMKHSLYDLVSINSIQELFLFLKCFRSIWQSMQRGMWVFCLKCNRRFPSLSSPSFLPRLNMLMKGTQFYASTVFYD